MNPNRWKQIEYLWCVDLHSNYRRRNSQKLKYEHWQFFRCQFLFSRKSTQETVYLKEKYHTQIFLTNLRIISCVADNLNTVSCFFSSLCDWSQLTQQKWGNPPPNNSSQVFFILQGRSDVRFPDLINFHHAEFTYAQRCVVRCWIWQIIVQFRSRSNRVVIWEQSWQRGRVCSFGHLFLGMDFFDCFFPH